MTARFPLDHLAEFSSHLAEFRFSGIVCLRQSGASLVRGGSEVDAVRLLRKLLSLNFCDDPLRGRRERVCFLICITFRYLCHLVGENCVAYFSQNPANK
jgi:hypothetical protein